MSSEVKWIRIGEATRTIPTVRSKSLAFELMKHQKKYLDPEKGLTIPGVFVNEACTSLKVFSTEVTRDKRGKIRRRQRTKSFPRRREYAEANALDAAVAFKERMDAAARAGITPEPDYATMTVDGVFERRGGCHGAYRLFGLRRLAPQGESLCHRGIAIWTTTGLRVPSSPCTSSPLGRGDRATRWSVW